MTGSVLARFLKSACFFDLAQEGHVLFLDSGIYEGRLGMVRRLPATVLTLILLSLLLFGFHEINANALFEDQLNTCLAYTMAEMDKFRGGASRRYREGLHTTEILVVGILRPLLHD